MYFPSFTRPWFTSVRNRLSDCLDVNRGIFIFLHQIWLDVLNQIVSHIIIIFLRQVFSIRYAWKRFSLIYNVQVIFIQNVPFYDDRFSPEFRNCFLEGEFMDNKFFSITMIKWGINICYIWINNFILKCPTVLKTYLSLSYVVDYINM